METKSKKLFSREYKAEVAALVVDGKYSVTQASVELDIDHRNIRRWVKELVTGKKESHKKKTDEPAKDECFEPCNNKACQKKIRSIEMEKDILKKAAAFFAKESLKDMNL
jgi:transposase